MEVKISSQQDLNELGKSDTRILLLYSTKQEGSQIMTWAKEAGLTENRSVFDLILIIITILRYSFSSS